MSITVNGQSCVPPGFRFHPTEEELLNYYLRKKLASQKIDLDVIRDVDLNKLEPWDIQETCMIGSTPQSDWYFFSHKDRKYPTGTRTNRATAAGFWKATGRDKAIYTSFRRIGMRKTLVFYRGRAPHGHKSDWIMHEYRLDEVPENGKHRPDDSAGFVGSEAGGGGVQEDGWVICRVFKKKNHNKSLDAANNSSSAASSNANAPQCPSSDTSAFSSQILHSMGRPCCKEEEEDEEADWSSGDLRFLKLPALHSPNLPWLPSDSSQEQHAHPNGATNHAALTCPTEPSSHMSWAALDRLLATELDGGVADQLLPCFEDAASLSALCSPASAFAAEYHHHHHGGDGDLWSLAKVASSTQSNQIRLFSDRTVGLNPAQHD